MGYRVINNRKRTKGRLARQVIVFTNEYIKLRKELCSLNVFESSGEKRRSEINRLIFDNRGKIRKSMYKSLYVENTQKDRDIKKKEVINKE